MRLTFAFSLLVAVVACSPEAPPPPQKAAPSISASLADPVDTLTGLPASCDLSRVEAHADAAELLREFVDRDSKGEFLENSKWFEEAAECPGHVAGWDSHAI